MQKKRIVNGKIFSEQGSFLEQELCIVGEEIVSRQAYLDTAGEEIVLNARGAFVIPSLTDSHFHGAMGCDTCDGTKKALETIARYELENGVMQITPATMTVSEKTLEEICGSVRDFAFSEGADLLGLYMEGPFINPRKKGAQNAAYIQKPDSALFKRLQERSNGAFKTVALSPELPGSYSFIRENAPSVRISIAHTCADYDTARKALSLGASCLTHTFNAMPGLGHREPGPIAAAAEDPRCFAELICDGIHVHPAMVRLCFQLFGEDRIIMISDSMRAAGLKDGLYDLGGQTVQVSGKKALLSDGTIAGSVTNLMDCLRCAVLSMGIPLICAVKAASVNPARALGHSDHYGSLTPGHLASLILLEEDLSIRQLIHRGRIL